MVALGLGAVLVIGVFFLFFPRPGGLVVAVAGPGKKQVDAVQVFVDGRKQCDTSPCVIRDLSTGNAHIVKIKAPGYANPADQPVSLKAGEDVVVNIDLSPASTSGTGLRVTSEGSGLKLWIDGKEVGLLPQEIKDITPGEHAIKVGGNDRYETYEEKVTVTSDAQKAVGPLKLKVLRGLANIEAGSNAEGAKIILVSGGEKRAITRLPTHIDIVTEKEWKLVASKKGFVDYQTPLSFDGGIAERTFTIDLHKPGQSTSSSESSNSVEANTVADLPTPVATPKVVSGGPTTPKALSGADAKKAKLLSGLSTTSSGSTSTPTTSKTPTKAAPAAGQGTLNVNSIPVSNVIVDGRPMGSTPKMGLSVAPGTHTIVFVHPEHGRKVVTVTVVAGQAATAATRFP
jgi:serine/threonine-protein kinase